ncbi:hypothetical protein ABZ957_03320 [Streptomyces sp. NPDC046316]|uniref:hypothetical protein n=1 Tax=Streptomyces sp. NPDC046316 TaxID=3154494 RepID=UPI0033C93373
MTPLTYTERAQFCAAAHSLGGSEAIRHQAFMILVEMMAQEPSPWEADDPFAAERYLVMRGATTAVAAERAPAFELSMRALHALATGVIATSFDEVAAWIETDLGGAA